MMGFRSKSGPRSVTKTRHRLSTSVSDVPYTPEDLSSGDASGSGKPSSSVNDKIHKRRARSSLGGTEDLIKELDTLAPDGNGAVKLDSGGMPATARSADGRPDDSQAPEYPALRAQPSEPDEDSEAGDSFAEKEFVTSGQNILPSKGSNEAVPEDSSVRHPVNHPDVVELETQGGSAVQLKAGAYSTHEDKDLWICRQCGWTYPNANPSAKQRRNHKKVCEKLYSGVEVPPGSSDDASSGDEVQSEEQVMTAVSSAATDEATEKAETVPKTFIKPTISTESDSAKSTPVTSPSKRDSPFNSPARRDPRLHNPAKKETPWGSPIKRSTPVNSPTTSKKGASPITSPVKRIMSTPVKRDSPPRPEKQEGLTRTHTSKQQQEEEERKFTVKKRIQELERITSSKPQTWAGRSGELSSTGSPLRHGDDDRRKSTEISPSGKLLKPLEPGGRKSLDFSPGAVSGKPLRHVQSSRKSGELSSTGSTSNQSANEKVSPSSQAVKMTEASVGETTLQAEAAITPPEVSSAAEDRNLVPLVMGSNSAKDNSQPEKKISETSASVSERSEEKGAEASQEKLPSVNPVVATVAEEVPAADAVLIHSAEKMQDAGKTVPTSQKLEEPGEGVLPARAGEGAKSGTKSAAHSRNPSLVLGKGDVSLLAEPDVSADSGPVIPSLETTKQPADQIVDVNEAQIQVGVSEDSTGGDRSVAEIDIPLNAENAVVKTESPSKEAEDSTSSAKGPVVHSSLPVDESSSSVGAPVSKEEPVQQKASSTEETTSDVIVSKVEGEREIPTSASVLVVESVIDQIPSSKLSTESRSVKVPETVNSVGTVSPSAISVDHDDDNCVLLKKQPAVDPLFVESQLDRLWEMHSQELTRRDGEASGADVRESSAQDDDPVQYANGSPLTPDAASSGAKTNGNGTSEKGSKVDRPRTPLRSLIAEDDAADKGDESAPTGKETPIVSPRGNLFKRIVSGGKASPTKPSTPVAYDKKSHSRPFLSSCICCSPVK